MGVEGRLLDEPTATARGITVAQQKGRVQIRVPFGAEGGYGKVNYTTKCNMSLTLESELLHKVAEIEAESH